jgi:hypothetical protein
MDQVSNLTAKRLNFNQIRFTEGNNWWSLSYIFHIGVVLMQIRVMDIERAGKFNHRRFPTTIFWGTYLVSYAITIWYFLIFTDYYQHIYNRTILLLRFMIVFMLCAYDFANHKDFHGMYVVEENQLLNGLMEENLYTERKRHDSFISSAGASSDDIKIRVLDRMVSKVDERTYQEENYFELEVLIGKKRLHKLEKSYNDFKAFEQSLGYGIRDSGIEAPKLEDDDLFGKLMANSNDLFK